MRSIERRAYTVREFAQMYGKSASWGKREVESGRIEARFPEGQDTRSDDYGRGDQQVGEVVECRSWRTRDDKPVRLIDLVDDDAAWIIIMDVIALVALIVAAWPMLV